MNWNKIKENINEIFKIDINNEEKNEAKVFQTTDEPDKIKNNIAKEKTPDKEKVQYIIPYAPFVKYIAEKYGLGDVEDFQKRINAINRFYDNVEIGNNIQSLGAKAKSESIKKGKDLFLPKGLSKDEGIKYWDEMANNFNDVLKKLELKEMNESELLNAMKDKGFVPSTDREASRLLQKESSNAINNFSKKGQKVPFSRFNPNKPRSSVANATKKFNKIKGAVDVLSNAKLNTFLDLFLTPTPLYEPSIEDIRKKNGLDKLDFNPETEQPSDNQTE